VHPCTYPGNIGLEQCSFPLLSWVATGRGFCWSTIARIFLPFFSHSRTGGQWATALGVGPCTPVTYGNPMTSHVSLDRTTISSSPFDFPAAPCLRVMGTAVAGPLPHCVYLESPYTYCSGEPLTYGNFRPHVCHVTGLTLTFRVDDRTHCHCGDCTYTFCICIVCASLAQYAYFVR
jgi:hypothetical protein